VSSSASLRDEVIITTSWDDGHRLDSRLAALLAEYQLPGTFYISPESAEIAPADRLSGQQVAELAGAFEVGAHTLTHPRLSTVDESTARQEIEGSRRYLEDVTGSEITSFCYPYGDLNETAVELVRAAGFTYARTVRRFSTAPGADLFRAPTTVHAYSHRVDAAPALRLAQLNPSAAWRLYRSWDLLAMRLFDQTLRSGGVFHLWGHSWEIDAHGDWDKLRRVFAYIAGRPGARYVVNGLIPSQVGGQHG
jgi:peptidoglycan-N-acetylglucosamine deacetylase